MKTASLAEVVWDCASAAVDTQRVLDAGYGEWERITGAPRMRIQEFSFETSLAVEIIREAAFEVRVIPLNLGYSVSRRRMREADVKVTVHVQQLRLA